MTNVAVFPGASVPSETPNEKLIQYLEEILADAKSGKLQSFVGTGFFNDGLRLTLWADYCPNYFVMLGAIASLQHEFVERREMEQVKV